MGRINLESAVLRPIRRGVELTIKLAACHSLARALGMRLRPGSQSGASSDLIRLETQAC